MEHTRINVGSTLTASEHYLNYLTMCFQLNIHNDAKAITGIQTTGQKIDIPFVSIVPYSHNKIITLNQR